MSALSAKACSKPKSTVRDALFRSHHGSAVSVLTAMTTRQPAAPPSEPVDADPLLIALAHTPDDYLAAPFRGTERYRVRRRLGEGG